MNKILCLPLALGMALISMNSHAQFRCEGKIIEKGRFSKLDVSRYCGNPLMKDSYKKSEASHSNGKQKDTGCIDIDQWYYTQGPNKTTYVVEFEKGFVTRVVRGADKP